MFKLSFFTASLIVVLVAEMLIGKTAAGDCNGLICGCYKGYCWAYASASSETKSGDWWCYTQVEGTVGKQSNWQYALLIITAHGNDLAAISST